MAALSEQILNRDGLLPIYGAASASDTFPPGPLTFLHIKNGGGSPDNVVVSVQRGDPSSSLLIADETLTVPNASERMFGPFPEQFFASPTTGLATVTHSFTTSVTVACVRLQDQS